MVGEHAGRYGDIDRQTLQLKYTKGFSDELDGELLCEQRMQLARRKSGNLEVQIARLSTEHQIS